MINYLGLLRLNHFSLIYIYIYYIRVCLKKKVFDVTLPEEIVFRKSQPHIIFQIIYVGDLIFFGQTSYYYHNILYVHMVTTKWYVKNIKMFSFISIQKTSITSNSPPDCPRSIKRQAPKPPPLPPSAKYTELTYRHRHSVHGSFSDDDDQFRPNDVTIANRKLLAEYCEQIEKEQSQNMQSANGKSEQPAEVMATGDAVTRDPSTLPLTNKRPAYEKKKYGKAGKVGLKIKKFLRIPSRESVTSGLQQQPKSPRPKLEIIHPLDINKSAVEIINNASEGFQYTAKDSAIKGLSNYYSGQFTAFSLGFFILDSEQSLF